MNCSNCGAQLSGQSMYCASCGAATQTYRTLTDASPDEATVEWPDSSKQHPSMQTEHDSPAYYGRSEPYSVTPLPPDKLNTPRRGGGKRVVVIVAVLVLVLLIGAGGAFALLRQSPGSSTNTSVSTSTAQKNTFTGKGTSTIVESKTLSTQQDGDNQINTVTLQAITYGDIAGSFTAQEDVTVRPDKTETFTGQSTCICTVSGKSGTLRWSLTGTQAADGKFQGRFFDFQGSGDLAGLHGEGVFQGQDNHDTYSVDMYFA